jgi:tellurite resistance protein TerC
MSGDYSIASVLLFCAVVIACLLIDLFAHKSDESVSIKSAVLWTLFWIMVSLAFGAYIWGSHGGNDAYAFLSGYVLEKALAVDNLFVMMAIFTSFHIADKYQHRVLYYGILGAMMLRLIFVAAGITFISKFGDVALGVFGVFIIWSAVKMLQATGIGLLACTMFLNGKKRAQMRNAYQQKKESAETDYSKHWSTHLFRHLFKVHPKIEGRKFFVAGAATPLFLCLLTIEFADIMFSFDSVPAIIAITEKPFLVYTSNIFAILGMRSMYFCLAALKRKLAHLEKAVVATLIFIGVKMLLELFFRIHLSPGVSLAIILGMMAVGVAASLIDEKWRSKQSRAFRA